MHKQHEDICNKYLCSFGNTAKDLRWCRLRYSIYTMKMDVYNLDISHFG